MQEKYKQLAHKLNNRPSKEDLVHLNILKGSSQVQPNIGAAQQRYVIPILAVLRSAAATCGQTLDCSGNVSLIALLSASHYSSDLLTRAAAA